MGSRRRRQLSRSETIPLTVTESSGCPLTGTGKLHWGCSSPNPSKPNPNPPEELPGERRNRHSRSPHAQNGARPRPKMAAAPPRRAPSPSLRPRRPPALSVRSRRAAVPACTPPARTSVPPSRCGVGASGAPPVPGAVSLIHSPPPCWPPAPLSSAAAPSPASALPSAGPPAQQVSGRARLRPSRRSPAAVRARVPGPAGSEAAGPGPGASLR